ncbi:hypothetical protein ACHAW6_003667 [Cyclotella cf. meneghiniana]
MDNNKVYVVICSNVTIIQEGETPFEDEVAPAASPNNPGDTYIELWGSHIDTAPSVNASYFYDRDSLAADMARLRAEGIEVDTKPPALENDMGEPKDLPATCRCERKELESWNKFSCPTIADMDLLLILRMCMPEEFIREVCIPATNKHTEGEKLTLPEFYKRLGCCFFMACFIGVSPMEQWWSQKPISQFEGAPLMCSVCF